MWRVCAITRERPSRLPAGPAGGRLESLACGPLLVVAEEAAVEIAPTPEALARHDEVVRALAAQVEALLPARFGWLAPDPRQLAAQLEPHADRLLAALELTAGREQMTLRVYGQEPAPESPGPAADAGGSGTRYLLAKQEAARRREQVPEIDALRAALAGAVHAERVQRHEGTPLLASVYHLIQRGGAEAYRAIVQEAAPRLEPVQVTVSGPWAPYAFAPEALA
jgi:gas vesicle protein GvpL/GvpF